MRQAAPTFTVRIWIAGDYDDAVRAAREFAASEGACFALAPVDYVYTGGAESGVCATLINYARFPSEPEALTAKAFRFAEMLCARLYQQSYSVETPTETVWVSYREA